MTHQLFIEIANFDSWARSHYDLPQDDIGGEWECSYQNWEAIYKAFEHFVKNKNANELTSFEKGRLLYIIARDNEMQWLSQLLDESFLLALAEYSLSNGHRDDKWQLAVQLHKLVDKEKTANLLEKFVNDPDEYVNRRSLMELAKIKSDNIEAYAERFWHKDKYGDMEEYQKIAVLHVLKSTGSKLLEKYIQLAKASGLPNLVQNAMEIQNGNNCV